MTAPRPYATYTHKELLDAYRDPPPDARAAIMAELDRRQAEFVVKQRTRKPFSSGWTGHDHGRRAAGEHKEKP